MDVRPQTAWLRSGCGQHVNSFEYHGDAPTRDGFLAFQRDLRDLMLREVGAEIVTVMEPPLHAVSAEDSVREAVELLTGERQALLVVADGRPAGIVTRADLLESLAR